MSLLQAKTSEYLLCASQCSGSRDRVMTNTKDLVSLNWMPECGISSSFPLLLFTVLVTVLNCLDNKE